MDKYDRWYDKPLAALVAGAIVFSAIKLFGLVGISVVAGLVAIQQIWYRMKYGFWQR